MLKSGKGCEEDARDLEDLEKPILSLVGGRVGGFLKETLDGVLAGYQDCIQTSLNKIRDMSRRRGCEEMGAVYLLRSVKDQVTLLQEKRGFNSDENNFVNLCSIIVQQTGQALYTLVTMFLALLPAATIFLHVSHFLLDRLLDIVTTRRQSDLVYKGTIFIIQLIAIFWALHFLVTSIFSPIVSMQLAVVSKLNFFTTNPSASDIS